MKIILFLSLVLFWGCGSPQSYEDNKWTIVASGTGVEKVTEPLTRSNHPWNIQRLFHTQFLLNEGGFIELHMFADQVPYKETGVVLRIERQGEKLLARLDSNGEKAYFSDFCSETLCYFSQFPASLPIKLLVEIHNNETPLHIILTAEDPLNNPFFDSAMDSIHAGTPDHNPFEDSFYPQPGRGNSWGIVYENVEFIEARVGKAIHGH